MQTEPADTVALISRPRISRPATVGIGAGILALAALVLIAAPENRVTKDAPVQQLTPPTPAAGQAQLSSTIDIYLGNGCFWERQWAYFGVETSATGAFKRAAKAFSAKVGYAGGRAPSEGNAVCYHTGDARDYSTLGHAEVVRVSLDASSAEVCRH